jgi:ribosomal protein S18 acetylase RimI-like enzyme
MKVMDISIPDSEIRVADLSDLSALVEHNLAMALETENLVLKKDIVEAGVLRVFQDTAKGFYLIAEINQQIAGSLMITFEWSDWRNEDIWWIQSVYIRPDFRKKGIYKKLYNSVKKMALESGTGSIRLYVEQTNTQAKTVYLQLGMEHSHYNLFEVNLRA